LTPNSSLRQVASCPPGAQASHGLFGIVTYTLILVSCVYETQIESLLVGGLPLSAIDLFQTYSRVLWAKSGSDDRLTISAMAPELPPINTG